MKKFRSPIASTCLLSLFAMWSSQPALAQFQQSAEFQRQLAEINQQNVSNLQFQHKVDQFSRQFSTLSSAQKAMHDAIMGEMNNIPDTASRVQTDADGALRVPDQQMQNFLFQQQVNQQSQSFLALSNAQKAMHDAIMATTHYIDNVPPVQQKPADQPADSLQNLQFQQRMAQLDREFMTLNNAQRAMHDAIMRTMNNIPDAASRGVRGLNVGDVGNSASIVDTMQQDAVMLALVGLQKVVPVLDQARQQIDDANALINVVSTVIDTAIQFEQSRFQDTTEQGSEEKPKVKRKREVRGPVQDEPPPQSSGVPVDMLLGLGAGIAIDQLSRRHSGGGGGGGPAPAGPSRSTKPTCSGGVCSSDIRSKQNVTLLGRLDNGIGIYRYRDRIDNEMYVGVVAQDVKKIAPEAVARGQDGRLLVDYQRLGLRLVTWDEWIAVNSNYR